MLPTCISSSLYSDNSLLCLCPHATTEPAFHFWTAICHGRCQLQQAPCKEGTDHPHGRGGGAFQSQDFVSAMKKNQWLFPCKKDVLFELYVLLAIPCPDCYADAVCFHHCYPGSCLLNHAQAMLPTVRYYKAWTMRQVPTAYLLHQQESCLETGRRKVTADHSSQQTEISSTDRLKCFELAPVANLILPSALNSPHFWHQAFVPL